MDGRNSFVLVGLYQAVLLEKAVELDPYVKGVHKAESKYSYRQGIDKCALARKLLNR